MSFHPLSSANIHHLKQKLLVFHTKFLVFHHTHCIIFTHWYVENRFLLVQQQLHACLLALTLALSLPRDLLQP